NSVKDFVPLSDELAFLETYIHLEKMRFPKEITVSIDMEAAIDPEDIYIPAMLIQPLVENAFHHGLLHLEGHKKLQVRFNLEDGQVLRCEIEDNGIGFEQSKKITQNWPQPNRPSGMNITQDRLKLIRKKTGKEISIQISPPIQGTDGTLITLKLPYWQYDQRNHH
ncbi:MAG: hypothetical protein AAFP02_09930, partial [Bacteroidota bacterium]